MPGLQSDDLVQAALFHLIRHIVRVMCRRIRSGPLGVFEHITEIVPHIFHQGKRLAVIFLRFRRIARYHVHRDPAIGYFSAYAIDQGHVLLAGVPPPHMFEYAGRAALKRQMQITANIFMRSDRIQHVIRHIVRIGRTKTDAHIGERLRYPGQQARKAQRADLDRFGDLVKILFRPAAVPQIRIDILPQKGHFPAAFLLQSPYFIQYGLRIATAFPPPGIRHHAIRTHIVASPHHRHECRNGCIGQAQRGDPFVSFVQGQKHVHRRLALQCLLHQPGKVAVRIRSGDQVHHLLFFQQFFFQPLGHTPQHAYHQARAAAFEVRKIGQFVPYGLFGLFPHRTRIDQDQVGVLYLAGERIALSGQNTGHHFAVGHIHLAAVRFDKELLPLRIFHRAFRHISFHPFSCISVQK